MEFVAVNNEIWQVIMHIIYYYSLLTYHYD